MLGFTVALHCVIPRLSNIFCSRDLVQRFPFQGRRSIWRCTCTGTVRARVAARNKVGCWDRSNALLDRPSPSCFRVSGTLSQPTSEILFGPYVNSS
jgi:hypothetical protein